MKSKFYIVTGISILFAVSAVLFWNYREKAMIIKDEAPNAEDFGLPIGYTLGVYTVATTTAVSCATHSECLTPPEYLIRSNCPYVSICLENKCTVVCPGHQ